VHVVEQDDERRLVGEGSEELGEGVEEKPPRSPVLSTRDR
jgi:hypothetical protein